MPKSSRVPNRSPPALSIFPKPSTKDIVAPAASSLNAFLNSLPVMPATLANFASSSPPALASLINVFENAVPPACASIPTLERAPAKPRVCASVRPITFPAPARRRPISMISLSVVARLLPRSTIVEPRLENFF